MGRGRREPLKVGSSEEEVGSFEIISHYSYRTISHISTEIISHRFLHICHKLSPAFMSLKVVAGLHC